MKFAKLLLVIVALTVLLLLSLFVKDLYFDGGMDKSSSVETGGNDLLLQYEWSQLQGDPSFTRFSAGPAPEAPDILWKVNITGIQSYVTAFNGKVFVTTKTAVYALDREAGSILWNTTVPAPGRWPAVYKIDATHLVIGNSSLDIETGRILWTSPNFSANTATFVAGAYSPDEKMFYVKTKSLIQGWNFSDPSIPPTLEWETYVSGGGQIGSGVTYGDGKVFPGSFESHQMALDAKTGRVLWDTETKTSMLFAGSYSDGKFFRGGAYDNNFYCFDADNGAVLWIFNPGTHDGYWCSGSAVAYGMVYGLNKDGHLYALDINTGDVVWKYKGPGTLFFPGNPVIADGKVYATTGQAASYDPTTGKYSQSEFACLDAFTGQLIWTIPVEAFSPRESVAVAYGNLYVIPAYIKEQEMDDYTIFDQVWAIGTRAWSMWRRDPAHTATGQSGPTNLSLRWKFTTGGAVVSSPSAADGIVYVGSQDKNVYSLDAWSGELLWKFNISARIASSPAVVNGKVFVGPDDGHVYCLDAYNGTLIWVTPAGGYIPAHFAATQILRSSPTVVGDRVYVGSLDTNVYSLDANNGGVNWTYKTEGYITSSPAVADGVVYIISQELSSGGLYQLNVTTGELIRRIALPYYQPNRGTDIMASPAVADGMVFAASNKKAYYGINVTTGDIEWTFKDDDADEFIICSPIYHDGVVYLVDQFFIVAVNAFSGQTIWRTFLGAELYVSPTYADGKLYVTTDQRSIYVLNATNGEKLSYFGTSSNSWSSPTLYEGRLYVGNNDWNVYCLSEYLALNSSVIVELANFTVVLGESVTGFGRLVPRMANASIVISFVKPDGAEIDMAVVTSEKGVFSFSYTPAVVGNWTVVAHWQPTKGYYAPAFSEHLPLEVAAAPTQPDHTNGLTEMPMEYIYAFVTVIVIITAALLGYLYMKRTRK